MTPNVVVGKRIGFWQAMSPGMKLFIFGAPTAGVVLSVRSFVAGDTTWGGIYAFLALVLALVAKSFWSDARATSEIVSACPVCGVERQRNFIALRNEAEPPSSCGACIAYLRVNLDTLQVREERADAIDGFYWVGRAQYESVVPRGDDEQRRFKFEMPTMCAVCGVSEAPALRTLAPMATPDAGVIGAVASGVATEVAYETGIEKVDRRYGSNTVTSDFELDLQLRELQMHVCAEHTRITAHGVEYEKGNLAFPAYRHYKAFCELNHITAGTDTLSPAPATARVVSS
jgi:hypothetical protein